MPPRGSAPGRWSSHRAGPSWRASPVAGETDAFALDATNTADSLAVRVHDRDSPASREVASIPIRIWPGVASSWVSFSTNTCHPSLALAKVIGLTTTLLSGRQMACQCFSGGKGRISGQRVTLTGTFPTALLRTWHAPFRCTMRPILKFGALRQTLLFWEILFSDSPC